MLNIFKLFQKKNVVKELTVDAVEFVSKQIHKYEKKIRGCKRNLESLEHDFRNKNLKYIYSEETVEFFREKIEIQIGNVKREIAFYENKINELNYEGNAK